MTKCNLDLQKPLYVVGAGDLGTDPSALNEALTKGPRAPRVED